MHADKEGYFVRGLRPARVCEEKTRTGIRYTGTAARGEVLVKQRVSTRCRWASHHQICRFSERNSATNGGA